MQYRWKGAVREFDMPVWIGKGEKSQQITPTKKWQKFIVNSENITDFLPDEHLYLINLKEK